MDATVESAASPQLVFLIGPLAVGKMTVGIELQRRTGLRLLHNHMTIDVVLPFFDFGTEAFERLVSSFRTQILREVADSALPGLLFTYVTAFDNPDEQAVIDRYSNIFLERGLSVRYVELVASQEERLRRNRTELRLEHKPSKRDLVWSDAHLIDMDSRYQLTTDPEAPPRNDWLRIDTTDLEAGATAELIINSLGLPRIP